MNNNKLKSKMFTFFNLLRGYVSREERITALAIIKGIRTKIIEYNITPDANRLLGICRYYKAKVLI